MTDESDNRRKVPVAGGDRPESHQSQTATDTTEDSPVRDSSSNIPTNRRRRYVLHCLETSETPMAVADLTDELVRWETGRSPTAVQDVREKIYTKLYHCHLPKLAGADLVSFDIDQKLVSLREDTEELPLDVVRPNLDSHPKKGR